MTIDNPSSLRASVPSYLRAFLPRASVPSCLRAFSLVEMMIAIVILGLGLVMVATMFPVAWDRARTLSEYTVEQAAAGGAQATLQSLLRPAGHSLVQYSVNPPLEEPRLTSGGLAGDMFFDPTLLASPSPLPAGRRHLAILAFADTSVHALNMENMLATPGDPAANPLGLVAEKPWDVEDPGNPPGTPTRIVRNLFLNPNYPDFDPEYMRNRGASFPDRLFYGGDDCLTPQGGTPQVRVWQRLYPPMEPPPRADSPDFETTLAQWNEKLATRRFSWAVLHRLRSRVGPARLPTGVTPSAAQSDELVRQAAAAMGSTRTFDVYYVTLRRPRPTNRYAQQDPNPAGIPNPFVFDRTVPPVPPAAKTEENDVMFPVAWRVQVQLPRSLAYRTAPAGSGREPTGIPTEMDIPVDGIAGKPAAMLVSMFPPATTFVDEIEGHVYRVVKRRIVDNLGEKAKLTLDREVVQEDIDIPLNDPRCENCTNTDWNNDPDPEELRRTVWVFPPAVDRSQSNNEQAPQFDGPSPVVDIQVGTLSISPSS